MFSLNIIPWYVKVLAVLGIALACYLYGRHDGTVKADLAIAKYEALERDSASKIKHLTENVKEKIVIQYVDRIKKVKEKEIVYVEVASKVPDQFIFSNGWVHVHDAAATGGDATSAGAVDATSSGIEASEGLKVITHNYSACRQNIEQINSLQLTIREFERIISEHNSKR